MMFLKIVIPSIQLKTYHVIKSYNFFLMKSVLGIIIPILPKAKRHYIHISKPWVEFKLGLKTFGPCTKSMFDKTCCLS